MKYQSKLINAVNQKDESSSENIEFKGQNRLCIRKESINKNVISLKKEKNEPISVNNLPEKINSKTKLFKTQDKIEYTLNANGDRLYKAKRERDNQLIHDYILKDFEDYFFVRKGKDYFICNWERIEVDHKSWLQLTKQTQNALIKGHRTDKVELAYETESDDGKIGITYKTESKSKIWLDSPDRITFRGGIVFKEKSSLDQFNMWHGLNISPKKGDWSLIQKHIFEIICDCNQTHYEYLLDWLADLYQNPFHKLGVALVLISPEKGTGKGTFVDIISTPIQDYFIPLNSSEQLTGKFNYHLEGRLLVFSDEAVWGGDKSAEGKLMTLITEILQPVEEKFEDTRSTTNYSRIVMASNNDWVIPAGAEERRYFVLKVFNMLSKMTNDEVNKYISELRTQAFERGGIQAMLYDLLRRDIRDKNLRKPPRTEALINQIHEGLGSVENYLYDCLESGTLLYLRDSLFEAKANTLDENYEPTWKKTNSFYIRKDDLYKAYLKFCEKSRIMHPKKRDPFFKKLYSILPSSKTTKQDSTPQRKRLVCLPERNSALSLFNESLGLS